MNLNIELINIKRDHQSLLEVLIKKAFQPSLFRLPILLLPISLNICYNCARLTNNAGGLA
jgi:hypothetical protein